MAETTAQAGGYIKVVSGTRITGMYRYFFGTGICSGSLENC